MVFHTGFVAFDHMIVKWRTGNGWELKLVTFQQVSAHVLLTVEPIEP